MKGRYLVKIVVLWWVGSIWWRWWYCSKIGSIWWAGKLAISYTSVTIRTNDQTLGEGFLILQLAVVTATIYLLCTTGEDL